MWKARDGCCEHRAREHRAARRKANAGGGAGARPGMHPFRRVDVGGTGIRLGYVLVYEHENTTGITPE